MRGRALIVVAGLVPAVLHAGSASLDLDLSPEEAEVYLDGDYQGICDDFDGNPDLLWVAAGRHTLEFRYPGYQTLRIHLELHSGQEKSFSNELPELEGGIDRVRVLDLVPRSAPPVPRATSPAPPSRSPAPPVKAEVAYLVLLVEPDDAAVWVDGLYQGLARSFEGNPEKLRLPAGSRVIELTRPGYLTKRLDLRLGREQTKTLRERLEPGS